MANITFPTDTDPRTLTGVETVLMDDGTGLVDATIQQIANFVGLSVGTTITATTDLTTFNVWRPVNVSTGTVNITLDVVSATSSKIVSLLATVSGGTLKVYNNTAGGTELFSYTYATATATGRLDFIFNGTAWVAMSPNEMFVPDADITAPTVSTLSPADNASSVAIGADLVVTFSESIAIGTGNILIKNLTDSSTVTLAITADSPQIVVSGSTLTINPTADLVAGKNYAIQIAATCIDDLSGNSFAGILDDTTWNFATASAGAASEAALDLSSYSPTAYFHARDFRASADGTAVSTWEDLVGSNDLLQATSGNRPTKQVSGSFNVVRFDGTNDYMDLTGEIFGTDENITIIAVLKPANVNDGVIVHGGTSIPLGLGDGVTGTVPGFYGNAALITGSTATSPGTSMTMLTMQSSGGSGSADGTLSLYKDGVSQGDVSDGDGNFEAASVERVGAENTPAGFLSADVALLVIVNSDISLTAIHAAIKSHYGIA